MSTAPRDETTSATHTEPDAPTLPPWINEYVRAGLQVGQFIPVHRGVVLDALGSLATLCDAELRYGTLGGGAEPDGGQTAAERLSEAGKVLAELAAALANVPPPAHLWDVPQSLAKQQGERRDPNGKMREPTADAGTEAPDTSASAGLEA